MSTPQQVLSDDEIVRELESAGVSFLRFKGGMSNTKDVWTTSGSQDVAKIANGVRTILAKLQAAPQAQPEAPASGCNYSAMLDQICNKCGRIHREAQAQQEQTAPNLSDPAVQKRLAAQWGYVPQAAQGAGEVDLSAWSKSRFGYFDDDGSFVEIGARDLTDHEVSMGPRWVGGGHDYALVRAALMAIPAPSTAVAVPDELREAARQFHNLTVGDPEVIIRPTNAAKRDAIITAGERLRAALATVAGPIDLSRDVDALRKGLQFYADKHHFSMSDPDAWDTVSGEPANFWCDEAGTATVEDGTIAAMVLKGVAIDWDDDDAGAALATQQALTGGERV